MKKLFTVVLMAVAIIAFAGIMLAAEQPLPTQCGEGNKIINFDFKNSHPCSWNKNLLCPDNVSTWSRHDDGGWWERVDASHPWLGHLVNDGEIALIFHQPDNPVVQPANDGEWWKTGMAFLMVQTGSGFVRYATWLRAVNQPGVIYLSFYGANGNCAVDSGKRVVLNPTDEWVLVEGSFFSSCSETTTKLAIGANVPGNAGFSFGIKKPCAFNE